MVVAPQKPPTDQPDVSRRWMWLAIALVVVIGGIGIALGIIIASDDAATTGPGPLEPVRSQDDAGPRGGPGSQNAPVLEGSGVVVTESRVAGEFDTLVLSGTADVIVTIDDAIELEVEADDNIVPLIETTVVDEVLTVATSGEGVTLRPSGDVVVRVSTPQLSRIEHTGVGHVMVGALTTDNLTVLFRGVGEIGVSSLAADTVVVEASGAGSVAMAGRVMSQTLSLGETADYLGADLESEMASVGHNGIGYAEIWVEQELDVVIRDIGSVSFYGDPAISTEITGGGAVIPLGER
jgi:hypothetical protein